MNPVSYVNGRFIDTPSVVMPVSEDLLGTLRGYRIFTSCRTVNGKVFHLDDHIDRLVTMAKTIYMPLGRDRDALIKAVLDTVLRNRALSKDLLLLIIFSGGQADESGMVSRGPADFYIITSLLKVPEPKVYQKGIALATYRHQRYYAPVKFLNYASSVIAQNSVVKAHCADAPLFVSESSDSQVLEGSTFNAFGVKDGCVWTPPLDGRILSGITRDIILQLAIKNGIMVKEAPMGVQELLGMDEFFITSSTRGAVPVVRIDQCYIGSGRPGPITQKLGQAYQSYLSEY